MTKPTPEQQNRINDLLAMQQRAIKRIVLSGGGAKGIVYPGAYRALQKSGVLEEVTDVAGSSAGAITAALIAMGAPIEHIRATAITTNIGSFLGTRVKEQVTGVIRPFTKDGAALYNFIHAQISHALNTININDLTDKLATLKQHRKLGRDLLSTINGTKKITFAHLNLLHQLYPCRFKNLTVTAVEYPSSRLQQFDYKHTPHVSIAIACRASASIPIALQPVEIEINGSTAFYIDGGMKNNLPTNLISDPKHYEETLVFAFGEGNHADISLGANRVEHAIHRTHWPETIELAFLQHFFKDVLAEIDSLACSTREIHHAVLKMLKQRETLAYTDPRYLSPHTAKKFKKYALDALDEVYKIAKPSLNTQSAEQVASVCWNLIKNIIRPLYKPHRFERLGQNIFPKYLLGLHMPVPTTHTKYEGFRRIRDHFPLRTVNLHVGQLGTMSFKKATLLARTMDAIGYADTMGHVLNHDLARNPQVTHYYDNVNKNFLIIYRALLSGMGRKPEHDDFLKRWAKLPKGNNQLAAIKSYVIKNPTSAIAFAFTRATEYQDQLIDRDTLFKETYVEAFKRTFFAKSASLGTTFFCSRSLEKALHKNPDLIPSLEHVAAKPRNSTRLNSIAHELHVLETRELIESSVQAKGLSHS